MEDKCIHFIMRNIIYLVNFKIIKKHSVFINLHTMNLFNSFSGTKYSVAYHFNLLLQGLTKKITYTFTNGTYSNTLRMTNIGWVKTWNVHLHTLKPRHNEPRYSEFRDIVNKTQLPFWGFTKQSIFDIVNYSI